MALAPALKLPSRMKLTAVRSSKEDAPLRTLVYGVDGVGKSTFGSESPSPIFISAEGGLKRLDVQMYPQPESFDEVLEILDDLLVSDHPYKTLVVDTLDWVEPLIWAYVCKKANAADIEAVGGGYQKGYVAALDGWRILLSRIEQLHEKKSMEVIFLAHAAITSFNNPAGADYKRYQAAFHQKAYDLVKQWVDVVGFANHEDMLVETKNKKIKGVSTGKRFLYLERTAAYDAKNRIGMPPAIAFDYASFAEAAKAGHAGDPKELAEECLRLADGRAEIIEYINAHETDAKALTQALNALRVKE